MTTPKYGSENIALPDGRNLSYNLPPMPNHGPVVLLASSLCANFTSWDHVMDRLHAAGFRTLRYDQPGHGQSGVPEDLGSTTFATLADDVATLLKHLGMSTIYAWLGVSMGAATGIYFVSRYPGIVNKLIVCDTISSSPVNAGTTDVFAPRVKAAREEGSMESMVEQTLERWFAKEWMSSQPKETSRMRSLMVTTTLDGFETCCAALRSPTFDLAPMLKGIGKGCNDALLVVGEKDADLPVKMADMRADIESGLRGAGKDKDVKLEVIKNAGHVSYIDGFEDFCKLVISFLKDP